MADAAYHRAWRAANPAKVKAANDRYRGANPGRSRMDAAQRPEHYRAYWRKRRGLPEPTRPCPPLCELCGGPPNGRSKSTLNLDHDHQTGKFRGWLCGTCNIGLGALGDNLDSLIRAVEYLKKY